MHIAKVLTTCDAHENEMSVVYKEHSSLCMLRTQYMDYQFWSSESTETIGQKKETLGRSNCVVDSRHCWLEVHSAPFGTHFSCTNKVLWHMPETSLL